MLSSAAARSLSGVYIMSRDDGTFFVNTFEKAALC